jgi:GT2 family glycosyltransferase
MQNCRPHCIVVDDGSSTPIPDEIVAAYPQFEYRRNMVAMGIVKARSAIASEVTTDVIASLDDDATYVSGSVLADALALMERPGVAAVSIPHINIVGNVEQPFDQVPIDGTVPMFIGCAYLVRRDVFLQMGRFRDIFIRQGEEDDFCLRLANASLRIARLDQYGVIHRPSPVRNEEMIRFYRVRNRLLLAFFNFNYAIFVFFAAREAMLLLSAILRGNSAIPEIRGYWHGLVDGIQNYSQRRAIPFSVVREYTRRKKEAMS